MVVCEIKREGGNKQIIRPTKGTRSRPGTMREIWASQRVDLFRNRDIWTMKRMGGRRKGREARGRRRRRNIEQDSWKSVRVYTEYTSTYSVGVLGVMQRGIVGKEQDQSSSPIELTKVEPR